MSQSNLFKSSVPSYSDEDIVRKAAESLRETSPFQNLALDEKKIIALARELQDARASQGFVHLELSNQYPEGPVPVNEAQPYIHYAKILIQNNEQVEKHPDFKQPFP